MRMGLAVIALLITTAITLSFGIGLRVIIDEGFSKGSAAYLNSVLLVMAVLAFVLAVATIFRFFLVTSLGELVTKDIRQAVFSRVVKLHPSYFEENRSGEIMSRLTTDTTLLQSIIGSSVSFALRSGLTMIGGLTMMLITNPKLTVVVILAVPLVLIPIIVFGKKVRELSKKSQDRVASVGTYAGEMIQQIKTVQSYHREDYEINNFENEVEQTYQVSKQRILYRSVLMGGAIFLSFIAIGIMIYVGGSDVIAGRMLAGELAQFVFYAMMVAMGVASVSEVMGELQRAAGATERLMELMNVESLIKDADQPIDKQNSQNGTIQFKNLTFNYPSRPDRAALENIDLTIQPGQTVAIVGPSGAGKSTMFEMLLRFYDPKQGEIVLNGFNIKDWTLENLRSNMAWVPQHPILFSDNVLHNIRYGNPQASTDDVIAAAKAANAHEFIEKLPEGYESYLGENGVRLSGGQKQRIVIARAILNNPNILLLDEATSALDAKSEQLVQQALDRLVESRTTLVIAHRLSTIKNADKIVVMDEGKIVATGTHSELMQKSELYNNLAQLQFMTSGQ
ncbi:MAG: ABC transporter transmembrane domain-containing protein [Pseudomonadales bacterium]|nr:ABC transporter transmembrane domain-containing protein [Pseudomonadales bacterium]